MLFTSAFLENPLVQYAMNFIDVEIDSFEVKCDVSQIVDGIQNFAFELYADFQAWGRQIEMTSPEEAIVTFCYNKLTNWISLEYLTDSFCDWRENSFKNET